MYSVFTIYVNRHHVALRSRSVCRKVDSPEKGEVRPGIVVRVLGEREGREGGETSGTSVDPGAVKAGRPRSFSGADPGRAAGQDRSGRVWGNGEGERGERYSSRNVRRPGRVKADGP